MLSFFGFSYGYSKIVSIITEHLAISHRVKAMLLPRQIPKKRIVTPIYPVSQSAFLSISFLWRSRRHFISPQENIRLMHMFALSDHLARDSTSASFRLPSLPRDSSFRADLTVTMGSKTRMSFIPSRNSFICLPATGPQEPFSINPKVRF